MYKRRFVKEQTQPCTRLTHNNPGCRCRECFSLRTLDRQARERGRAQAAVIQASQRADAIAQEQREVMLQRGRGCW